MMTVVDYLHSIGLQDDSPLVSAMQHFEEALATNKEASMEEAVPAEMMEVFTDEQWPALLFEFQLGTAVLSGNWDMVALHADYTDGMQKNSDQYQLEQEQYWRVAKDEEGQFVSVISALEYRAFNQFAQGQQFLQVAQECWPALEEEDQLTAMTEQVLRWIEKKLIIDAGVPLPEDAEFESAAI